MECEQVDIKHEEDPLSPVEIKIEPQDIKCELKPEAEECGDAAASDLEHVDIKAINHVIASMSEIENSEDSMSELLEDYEKRAQAEQKNELDEFCGASDTEKFNVIAYERLHAEKTSFMCKICRKSFSLKTSLTRHMIVHTGPFICDICDKRFSQKYHLAEHERTHLGKKPYKCTLCGKSFSKKFNLTSHILTHTSVKTFTCNICSKNFSRKGDLARHINSHLGEKSYACSICGKSFFRNFDLTRHMTSHSGEKPYLCSICSKSFSLKRYLTVHTRTQHQEPLN